MPNAHIHGDYANNPVQDIISWSLYQMDCIPGGFFSIHLLHYIKMRKKGTFSRFAFTSLRFQVKIDFVQQAAGLHKLTATTWVQGEKREQNAQESARWWLDRLGFFHKSVLFILPWTTEVESVKAASHSVLR